MSIIKNNWSNLLFFSDYRSGSFADIKSRNGNTATNALLNHSGLQLDGSTSNAIDLDTRVTFTEGTFLVKGNLKPIATFGSEFSYTALDSGYILYITPAGALKTRNSGGFTPDTTATINYNEDVVVGFTVSGTTVNFYVNGLFVESETIASGTFNVDRLFNGGVASSSYRADGLIESVVIFDKALTASEVAVITSELNESIPDQEVASKSYNLWKFAAKANGSTQWLDTGIKGYTSGALEFFFEFNGDILSSEMVAGSDQSDPDRFYFGVVSGFLGMGYGTQSWLTIQGTTRLTKGIHKVRYEFGTTNKIFLNDILEYSGASAGSPNTSTNIAIFAGDTAGGTASPYKIWNMKFENSSGDLVGLYPFQGNFNDYSGNKNNATQAGSSDVVFQTVNHYEKELSFKGEMHALANERTISSGFLENTGWSIQAGSAKVVTENKDSVSCRILENVSSGTIYRRSSFNGYKWSFWIKKGANGNDMRLGFMSDGVATNPFDASLKCFYIHINDVSTVDLIQNNNGATGSLGISAPILDLNWHLIEVIKVGVNFKVYLDKALIVNNNASINFDSKFMLFDFDVADQIIWSSENHQLDFYLKA
jgi:hypothetical protein